MNEKVVIAKESILDSLIATITSLSSDWVKQQDLSLVSTMMLDMSLEFIPALGTAISKYKIHRAISNLEIQVEQLRDHSESLQENLNIMSV